MKKLIKWILIILAVLIASFLLLAILLPDDEETSSETDTEYTEEDETGFGDVFDDIDEEGSAEHEALAGSGYSPDDTWAVYLYLCGSDLESEDGAATSDIMEMLEVELPENVQVVIETGGAYGWQNDWVDPNYLERYVYSSNGMELIEQQSLANMGDPDTLHDFLTFCKENNRQTIRQFCSGIMEAAALQALHLMKIITMIP